MSKLFRAVANLWREYNAFGKAEYEQLRQQNERLRAEIEAVRRRKAGLDAIAQKEVLGGIRATKEKLQAAKSTIEAEGKLIVDAVDQLAEEAAKIVQTDSAAKQKNMLQAMETLKKKGVESILSGGLPTEPRKKGR